MRNIPFEKMDWPTKVSMVLAKVIDPTIQAVRDERMPAEFQNRFVFNGIIIKLNKGKVRADLGQAVMPPRTEEELDELFNLGIDLDYEPEFELAEVRAWQDDKNLTDFQMGKKVLNKRPDQICNLVIIPEPPKIQGAEGAIISTAPIGKEHKRISEQIRQALQQRFAELVL